MGPYGSWTRMSMRSTLKEDWGQSGNETAPQYAQLECRRHTLSRMRAALDRLDAADATMNRSLALDVVEYLPDPKNPFMDMKDLRRTQASLLVERVLLHVTSEQDTEER